MSSSKPNCRGEIKPDYFREHEGSPPLLASNVRSPVPRNTAARHNIAAYREKSVRPAKPRNQKDVKPLKPAAIAYYEQRVEALLQSWPGFKDLEVRHLILVRIQVETNDPRPSANALHPVSICGQAGQACFQSSHYAGHV